MQVPTEIRKCVAFVGARDVKTGEIEFGGTAFFVSRPSPLPNLVFSYAVTALHVLNEIDRRKRAAVVRLNTTDGGFLIIQIGTWLKHPHADVAIAPLQLASLIKPVDHMSYPMSAFVTPDMIQKLSIGIGDEVFLTGLFTPHKGEGRNIPILRIGNISAMPEEPISTQMGLMDAYLIETRSLGGLSGSPVFLHLGTYRWAEGNLTRINHQRANYYLLGLMHGHFQLPATGIPEDPRLREKLNMGIGIVVPAEKIIEAMNEEFVLEHERKAVEKLKESEPQAVPDSSFGAATMDNEVVQSFTKEDFEAALRKASRKIAPEK